MKPTKHCLEEGRRGRKGMEYSGGVLVQGKFHIFNYHNEIPSYY
jgi:hypothetical protein